MYRWPPLQLPLPMNQRDAGWVLEYTLTFSTSLVVGEFICSAKAALNSQVIKGLLIQTKEDPVFLPWKSSQVWCLFLKKAATILAQDVMFFRIFIVGLICQIVRAQSQYEYMRVFPNEKNTVVQYSESVPEDLSSDRIKRRVFDTQKLYSALGQDGADIKEVLEQKACHNPKSTSDEYYLIADAATVAQGTHWATADHARVSLTINKDLSAKMNDVIGKMIP
ncbi:hypothetical protein Pst134EB_026036 [Puccinia striiformis f. sp. tritici]|nr:hypothetical protein Pst134EB_026036 [Puccinia striiformis f. sp. tritici]